MNKLTEEELTLFKHFDVTSADTDMFARLKLGGLVNFLIQSAISSADSLGFGLKYLHEENLFWVMSRLEVHIEKQLKWYDKVEVETWPKTVDGIFYIRDFIVRNTNKEVVAKATSAWLAIDTQRKRPKIIDGIVSEKFYALQAKKSLENPPEKLAFVEGGDISEIQSTFYDTDLNKHVTTARYVDWMMDQFSLEFHENNYPKFLSINFLKETMPNEKIKIFKNQLDPNTYQFEGLNIASEKQAFRGKIIF